MKKAYNSYVARNMRKLSKYTNKFICISDYVKKLVTEYGVSEEKLERIYCSTEVDVIKEDPSTLKQELGIKKELPVIGMTSIWRPNKGLHYFLSACQMINRWHPPTQFLLGGKAYESDSEYATNIYIQGQGLHNSGKLNYTGYIDDIGKFMSALDIFVLPSDCEPFGLVLIEAMARGIPIVATRTGGVPEIVKHGETGLLVAPKDEKALARGIYSLMCKPLQRHQMSKAAKLRAQEFFAKKQMIELYEELYNKVIN